MRDIIHDEENNNYKFEIEYIEKVKP